MTARNGHGTEDDVDIRESKDDNSRIKRRRKHNQKIGKKHRHLSAEKTNSMYIGTMLERIWQANPKVAYLQHCEIESCSCVKV